MAWTWWGLRNGVPADVMLQKFAATQATADWIVYTKILPRVGS